MLKVIAVAAPPLAFLLLKRPLAAFITAVCYFLAWNAVIAAILPGFFPYLFPLFISWLAVFWFAPAACALRAIKAVQGGAEAAPRIEYGYALKRVGLAMLVFVLLPWSLPVLYWPFAVHRLRTEVETLAAAPEREVHWDEMSRGGFPFFVQLTLTNVVLTQSVPISYTLRAPEVIIDGEAFGSDWHATMSRGVTLDAPNLGTRLEAEAAAAYSDHSLALIEMSANQLRGGNALEDLRIESLYGQIMNGSKLATGPRDDFHQFELSFTGVVLPRALPPPGNRIENAQIMANIEGRWPTNSVADALTGWRDAGGRLNHVRAKIHWGAVHLGLEDGTIKLDKALQPSGSFKLTAAEPGLAIDLLANTGWLSVKDADAAKSALSSLIVVSPEGPPRLVQQAQIDNSRLELGAAQLPLPRVVWP
jgi:hypothetical protein